MPCRSQKQRYDVYIIQNGALWRVDHTKAALYAGYMI